MTETDIAGRRNPEQPEPWETVCAECQDFVVRREGDLCRQCIEQEHRETEDDA